MEDLDIKRLEFIKLVCMLVILNQLQRKNVTSGYDKLSFKNVLD